MIDIVLVSSGCEYKLRVCDGHSEPDRQAAVSVQSFPLSIGVPSNTQPTSLPTQRPRAGVGAGGSAVAWVAGAGRLCARKAPDPMSVLRQARQALAGSNAQRFEGGGDDVSQVWP